MISDVCRISNKDTYERFSSNAKMRINENSRFVFAPCVIEFKYARASEFYTFFASLRRDILLRKSISYEETF